MEVPSSPLVTPNGLEWVGRIDILTKTQQKKWCFQILHILDRCNPGFSPRVRWSRTSSNENEQILPWYWFWLVKIILTSSRRKTWKEKIDQNILNSVLASNILLPSIVSWNNLTKIFSEWRIVSSR